MIPDHLLDAYEVEALSVLLAVLCAALVVFGWMLGEKLYRMLQARRNRKGGEHGKRPG